MECHLMQLDRLKEVAQPSGVVIAVGIFGNAFGPFILRLCRIKSKAAIGIALDTAAHGIGTARALEDGELTGAYSGLALCVNGIITAFTAPFLVEWLVGLDFWSSQI